MSGPATIDARLLHRFLAQDPRRPGGGAADFAALSGHHRCLLVTDGAVTSLIEAHALEPTRTIRLAQRAGRPTPEDLRWLRAATGTEVLARQVRVEGELSHRPYLEARSSLILDRLPPVAVRALADEGSSIGTVLIRTQVEHRRELLWFERREGAMASRTYRIVVRGNPAIVIHEDFLS